MRPGGARGTWGAAHRIERRLTRLSRVYHRSSASLAVKLGYCSLCPLEKFCFVQSIAIQALYGRLKN